MTKIYLSLAAVLVLVSFFGWQRYEIKQKDTDIKELKIKLQNAKEEIFRLKERNKAKCFEEVYKSKKRVLQETSSEKNSTNDEFEFYLHNGDIVF